jgi:hypothetical protein
VKLIPRSIPWESHGIELMDLVAMAAPLTQEQLTLFESITDVLIKLLEVYPAQCAARMPSSSLRWRRWLFQSSSRQLVDRRVPAAHWLALVASACGQAHALWIVDKAIEMAHQHVDPIAGKRSETAATALAGMKLWLRDPSDAVDVKALAVYQRTQRLVERLEVVVLVLGASLRFDKTQDGFV